MGWSRVRALNLAGLLLAATLGACVRVPSDVGPVVVPTPVDQAISASQPFYTAPYVINTGDQLTVRLYYNPQLDEDITVRPDGDISLSLIGDIKANGKTPDQLGQAITDAYGDYLTKPNATVLVRVSALARYFIEGEVGHDGSFDMNHGFVTVSQSISGAGGVLETGDLSDVVLVRRLPGQAQPMVIPLNIAKALQGADPKEDMLLLPNDFVYVPRSGTASLNVAVRLYFLNNLPFSTGVSASSALPAAR